MKLVLEVLLAILLHPVATILSWVNLAGRSDLSMSKKVIWAIVCIIPVGPILYVLVGGGGLW